ncbi:unnamed protein product [Phyllotreta striolata]|uniref:L antigen family member 3 n=1 Tax=Phyllotreta striolata TaxID=444603 RepID=A0A9N9TED3_PHYSR|nr:unnamed protein product [Phyllotreta striolata]
MSEELFKIFISEIQIPFESKKCAEVAYDVLRVDKEPKRSEVSKQLGVRDNVLTAHFSGKLARQLRVSVNGFFEKLDLVVGTIDLLGRPVSEKYDHY